MTLKRHLFNWLQDGLERRGYKEAGFLREVAEVVKTGKTSYYFPLCAI